MIKWLQLLSQSYLFTWSAAKFSFYDTLIYPVIRAEKCIIVILRIVYSFHTGVFWNNLFYDFWSENTSCLRWRWLLPLDGKKVWVIIAIWTSLVLAWRFLTNYSLPLHVISEQTGILNRILRCSSFKTLTVNRISMVIR